MGFQCSAGEVVEGKPIGAVPGPASHRPVVFHAVSFGEAIEGGIGLGLRQPDVLQIRLGFRLHRSGHRVQDVGGFMHPAVRHPGRAVNRVQRGPKPDGPKTRWRQNPMAPKPDGPGTRWPRNPMAPSATASLGAASRPPAFRFADLRFRSSSISRQLRVLWRKPQIRPGTSVLPDASAPIITRRHGRSTPVRGVKWTPSGQKYPWRRLRPIAPGPALAIVPPIRLQPGDGGGRQSGRIRPQRAARAAEKSPVEMPLR